MEGQRAEKVSTTNKKEGKERKQVPGRGTPRRARRGAEINTPKKCQEKSKNVKARETLKELGKKKKEKKEKNRPTY